MNSAKAKKQKKLIHSKASTSTAKSKDSFFSQKVKLNDMVIFSRQFAAMIGSGVAMLRTLTIISEQCDNPKLKSILQDIRNQVEGGSNLSDAMSRHPEVFDRLYISMIKAGETGGILEVVMKRLASFLEFNQKLTNQLKAAMVLPLITLVVAIIVFWGMLTFIIPQFQTFFTQMGGSLPDYTKMLIKLSEFMRSIWMLLVIILLVIGYISFQKWAKTPAGEYIVDKQLLRMPLLGNVIRKVAIARFTRIFSTLLSSGVPMLVSLDVVKETGGNAVLTKCIEEIHKEVLQGSVLSKPMSKQDLFPPMVTQMVSIGEESGKLDEMLDKIADFYDNDVGTSIEALTASLQPIMTIVVGGLVAAVLIGVYLPIFSLVGQIK